MSNIYECPDCGSAAWIRDTDVYMLSQDIIEPDGSVIQGQLTTPEYDPPGFWTCQNGHVAIGELHNQLTAKLVDRA